MHGKFDGLGRFADPSLLILTSLSDGPKHGYAIMTDIAAFSGVGMEPGTLYGALSRLERRGWIRPLAAGMAPCTRVRYTFSTWRLENWVASAR